MKRIFLPLSGIPAEEQFRHAKVILHQENGGIGVLRCGGGLHLPGPGICPELRPCDCILTGQDAEGCFYLAVRGTVPLPGTLDVLPMRSVFVSLDAAEQTAVARAAELLHWQRRSRYCGACGAEMALGDDGAMHCPACSNAYFPVLAPAVIVRVTREDGRILLAHNARFRGNVYGLIAGFVEAGETLEHAVCRELAEEVAVEVDSVRYFGSSPWPFPNSLMIGFTARYRSGGICCDGVEITDAGWFSPDRMPELPGPGSIARRMIDDFLKGGRG